MPGAFAPSTELIDLCKPLARLSCPTRRHAIERGRQAFSTRSTSRLPSPAAQVPAAGLSPQDAGAAQLEQARHGVARIMDARKAGLDAASTAIRTSRIRRA